MRIQLKRSRLVASLAGVVIVLSTANADAQSTDVVAEGRPDPGRLRTVVRIIDAGVPLRQNVFDEPLLHAGEAVAPAQGAASRRPRDSVLNGVFIGAGIGALAGLIPDYYDDCAECHDSLYASIAVGAGIGLVVDLLRSETRPTSPLQAAGWRLGIAGGRKALGLRGVLRWR